MDQTHPPIQAVIFDMNGTLIDDMPVHHRVWRQFLAGHGQDVPLDEVTRFTSGQSNPQILRRFFGDDLSAGEIERLSQAKEALYRRVFRPHVRLLPGLERFLVELRAAGLPVGLATSAIRPNVEFVLDALDLHRFFDVILTLEDTPRHKPAPDAYLLSAEQLGVVPHHCLIFEDSPTGLEAAARAGAYVCAVLTMLRRDQLPPDLSLLAAISDYTGVTLGDLQALAAQRS